MREANVAVTTREDEGCAVDLLRNGDLDLHPGLCSVHRVSTKLSVAGAH